MHRVLAKLAIAVLIILGDGAFVSENIQRGDESHEAGSMAARHLPSADDSASRQDPEVQHTGPVRQGSAPPASMPAVRPASLSRSPRYHAFYPRGPPAPAR